MLIHVACCLNSALWKAVYNQGSRSNQREGRIDAVSPIPRTIKEQEDDSRGSTKIPSNCTYPLVPLSLGTMRGRLIDLEPLTDRADEIPS